MFVATMVGWVFFRATTFGEAIGILRRLVIPTTGVMVSDVDLLAVGIMMVAAAWWSMRGPNAFEMNHESIPRRLVLRAVTFGVALGLIATSRPSPFLYFQF
jgi:alginate O-acetyltransferase complex protein AlgI